MLINIILDLIQATAPYTKYFLDYAINTKDAFDILRKNLDCPLINRIAFTNNKKRVCLTSAVSKYFISVETGNVRVTRAMATLIAFRWTVDKEQTEALQKVYDTLNLYAWEYENVESSKSITLDAASPEKAQKTPVVAANTSLMPNQLCPQCGESVQKSSAFCWKCGIKL